MEYVERGILWTPHPRKKELTKKEKKVLSFLRNFILKEGRSPTNKEIGDTFDISGAVDYIRSLFSKGYVGKVYERRRKRRRVTTGIIVKGLSIENISGRSCFICGGPLPYSATKKRKICNDKDCSRALVSTAKFREVPTARLMAIEIHKMNKEIKDATK